VKELRTNVSSAIEGMHFPYDEIRKAIPLPEGPTLCQNVSCDLHIIRIHCVAPQVVKEQLITGLKQARLQIADVEVLYITSFPIPGSLCCPWRDITIGFGTLNDVRQQLRAC